MSVRTHKDAVLVEALGHIDVIEKRLIDLAEKLDTHKSEIEEISTRWSDDIIKKSERIINATIQVNKTAIDNQIKVSMAGQVSTIENAVTTALRSSRIEGNRALMQWLIAGIGFNFLVSLFIFVLFARHYF